MIAKLLLFGATGDLAGRYLLPALASLRAAGRLPDDFEIVGAARQHLDDNAFRSIARERLEQHAGEVSARARDAVVRSLHYHAVDIADSASVARVVRDEAPERVTRAAGEPVAAYLALPAASYAPTVRALAAVTLPSGSRIALEKPFGQDLESAIALNRLLAELAGDAAEQAIFRVDHVLGMATVHNLLGLRLANQVLEPVWNSSQVEQIDILWEETLALEGRAGHYDRAGALRDVMQSHMLQVLCLLTMEPPDGIGERHLRDSKVDVLRAVRPLDADWVASLTRRARYTAGRLARDVDGKGRRVPAYADEEGVDPRRSTETFAEVVLALDNDRWRGTRFVLRTGKALARRRKEAVIRFRQSTRTSFGGPGGLPPNEFRIGLDGPNDLRMHLTGASAGPPLRPAPVELSAPPPASGLPAYARVLLDVLNGDCSLSVRGDESELAWRILTPVLQGWADGAVPLEDYPAGSNGPRGRRHDDR